MNKFYLFRVVKMGRGKHCTPVERALIMTLISDGKTYKEVQNLVKCSPTMIRNAIKYTPKEDKRGRPRAMSERLEKKVLRYSNRDPFAPATVIKKDLHISQSVETVRRCLRKNNLMGRSPRKVPFLKKIHIQKRLRFAREHLNWPIEKWRNILWSDESKIVLYGGRGSRQYVRRPPNTEYQPRFTCKTVKHGGSSIMIWGCFSYYGVGPLYWIKTIMDRHEYVKIMEDIMLPYASDDMPRIWTFQQDNDPKHTSKTAKEWFASHQVDVMEWPPQSPDLNPIENLWSDVKKEVGKHQPTNNNDLWEVVKSAWSSIPPERCQKLVDSMIRRCKAVIKNKGFTTKY